MSVGFQERDLRQLRVGDKTDIARIFGLENATSTHREETKARQTREIEQKVGGNITRRPVTSAGYGLASAPLPLDSYRSVRLDSNNRESTRKR